MRRLFAALLVTNKFTARQEIEQTHGGARLLGLNIRQEDGAGSQCAGEAHKLPERRLVPLFWIRTQL